MFELKDDCKLSDIQKWQTGTLLVYCRVYLFCLEYNLNCLITSLISDRKNTQSTSRTHEEGRAFDISTHGWSNVHIEKLCFLLNGEFLDIGAIGKDSIVRVAVYHNFNGQGDHIHCQIRRDANINRFF
jgi:hypothetical protein